MPIVPKDPVLPIDAYLAQIVTALTQAGNLILEAQPGAGKTTRVGRALLSAVAGEILVLEPRRLAARMAADRVAQELGEKTGGTVGYQVRFDEVGGPGTRLRFVTEGILTRRLIRDPTLRGVDVVILDEFHERHLDSDLALALLKRLQLTSRPDLRLVVMSATLDANSLAQYLSCPIVRVPGRLFDVAVSYTGYSSAPLEQQVADAVGGALRESTGGDILAFLPGAAEIRRAGRALEGLAASAGLLVLPLHGDLPPAEQDRAVQPAARRKIILSTNVAESSLTIEGVTVVIDSGLARVASDSAASGLPTLEVRRVSRASATQRAGRAGRTQPGRAIRLYSVEDFLRRPEHDIPEILRRELAPVVLSLRAMDIDDLQWLDPPPRAALDSAEELLSRLGADKYAEAMSRYPLHPRLSRFLIDAKERGVAGEAARIAAHLSGGERGQGTDVAIAAHEDSSWRTAQIERQIRRLVRVGADTGSDDDLRISLLTAFPDRVAKRRSGPEFQLANGKSATVAPDWHGDLLVAVDIEDRRERAAQIRSASPVEPEWLLELYPDRIHETAELTWNRQAERVEAVTRLLYDDITLEENRHAAPDPADAARLLARSALEAGLQRFCDVDEVNGFLARVRFAGQREPDPEATLTGLCAGLRSFRELEQRMRDGGLVSELRRSLGPEAARMVDALAPEYLPIKGRRVRVGYEEGKPPFIAARLQDFFGMKETPRVGGGKVPVVVHLLAPNGRPVQMTTDLPGFWERLYPTVRKELSRRYPRHAWPEKPV